MVMETIQFGFILNLGEFLQFSFLFVKMYTILPQTAVVGLDLLALTNCFQSP